MIDLRSEQVLDVRDVATRFKVSEVTVRKWFRRGCEHFKVGGSVRTTTEAIQRFCGLAPVPQRMADGDAQDAMKRLAAAGYSVR